jgi:prepilin-type N-terminal cleavage/methylation domain-containing protein
MNWCRGSSSTRTRHQARPGFTLLELMVVAALLVILTMMAFSGFRYLTAVMNKSITTTTARENLTVVMDQLMKELREATIVDDDVASGRTNDGSRATHEVTLPAWVPASDSSGGLGSVISSPATSPATPATLAPVVPDLAANQTYVFRTNSGTPPNGIVLEFFTVDTSATPKTHRIRYSLTAPKTSGGVYNGLGQRFWALSTREPCQVTYRNNTWDSGTNSWSAELPQPMTDQVVTGFTVTRPSWSSNVIQITLEAQVPGLGRTGYSTVRLIGLVTLRQ